MPSVLPQLDNDSILMMYLVGELPAEDGADVERMLANDAGLRAKLDELRAAYAGAGDAIADADARERIVLPAATAARRVGLAARSWHAARMARQPVENGATPERRQLRFPWWCYPLASAAAVALAAVSWWGFQPDHGPGRHYDPFSGPYVLDDESSGLSRTVEDGGSEEAITRTWENYAIVRGDVADTKLAEAEDELFAMASPAERDGSAIFQVSETDEQ